MAEQDRPDLEPQPDEASESEAAPKTRRSLGRVRRELSDEELGAPGVLKMLIGEIDRLERELLEACKFRESFHAADKRVGVLESKAKTSLAAEIISTSCAAVGSAALGFAPSIWSDQPAGWLCIAFGSVLVLAALIAKWVQR